MRKSIFVVLMLSMAIFAIAASASAGWDDSARSEHTTVFVSAFNAPDLGPACAEGPVKTAITLSPGQQVVITATGVAAWDRFSGTNGPDGSDQGLGYYIPGDPIGALIGRLDGGDWMHIGRGPTTVKGPGRLQLAFDDGVELCDNSGGFTVHLVSMPTKRGTVFVSAFNSPDVSAACAQGPVNTGINLSADEQVVLTATGLAAWDEFGGTNGPDGSAAASGHYVINGPIGALIGRIGPGEWMHIGSGPTTVSGPGRLQLAFDDAALLCNNSGGFTVDVHSSVPKTPEDCKEGDWQRFGVFNSHGDCIGHVTAGGRY